MAENNTPKKQEEVDNTAISPQIYKWRVIAGTLIVFFFAIAIVWVAVYSAAMSAQAIFGL